MDRPIWTVFVLLVCLGINEAAASEPPRVVASIKPIHSLVAAIMQGVGEPLLLMDGSVPPWEFTPDVADSAAFSGADLVVWTGSELEPQLAASLDHLDTKPRIMEALASDRLKILPSRGGEGRRDAYFWLDSRNMLILLDELTGMLIEMDPANARTYERNRGRAYKAISEIDRRLEYGYRAVSALPVFLYYDTHQYFEQAYAMKVAGHVAGAPGTASPIAEGLVDLKEWLRDAPVHCLFVEAGLPRAHLDLLLSGTDVTPIELDSLGIGLQPGPDFYVTLMQSGFETISGCVGASLPGGETLDLVSNAPDPMRFPERVTPRYLMTDQNGRTVSNGDFVGRYQLISFGYTSCPDVCPMTLAVSTRTMELLGAEAESVQPIFISVDPERDTPEVLKKYLSYFHPSLIGLSGTPSSTRRIAELFRARYERVPSEDGDPMRYTMDHTASHYLLGPDGEFITKFAYGLPADELAEGIRRYMKP